jgi:hypothetical protein
MLELNKAIEQASKFTLDDEKMIGGILDEKNGLISLANLDESQDTYIPDIDVYLETSTDQDAPFYGMWYTSRDAKPTKDDKAVSKDLAQDGGYFMVLCPKRVFVLDNGQEVFDFPRTPGAR